MNDKALALLIEIYERISKNKVTLSPTITITDFWDEWVYEYDNTDQLVNKIRKDIDSYLIFPL